jgi:glycosyltransferase involved in cell wall biosynthesis
MEIHAGETARGLAHRGHQVHVLTNVGRDPWPGDDRVTVHSILTRDYRAALRRIHGAARHLRADAGLVMNAGFAPIALRSRDFGPPIVVRTAGNDAYGAWHGPRLPLRFLFWRLPHRHPGSLGARLRRCDQDRRVAAILDGLARCERILCNSRYSFDRLRGLGVPGERLRLLVGGVDTERFQPVATGAGVVRTGPAVLGIAARLKPIKGLAVALDMMAILATRGHDAILRIAGSGPLGTELRARTGELGIDDRVEFVGDLGPDAMVEFYRGLDLYLQPSVEMRHEASGMPQAESMGRGLCEAQACGIPVVASRSGGIPDVVLDGVTGRLAPPGDAEALALTVIELLRSPETRGGMGLAGRRLMVERFTWKVIVRETERHLLEVAAPGPVRA